MMLINIIPKVILWTTRGKKEPRKERSQESGGWIILYGGGLF